MHSKVLPARGGIRRVRLTRLAQVCGLAALFPALGCSALGDSGAAAGQGGASANATTPGGTSSVGGVNGVAGTHSGSAPGGVSSVAGVAGLSSSGAGGVPATTALAPIATDVVIWLDADRGITDAGGKVSSWADQSTAHNDFLQADASRQPTLAAATLAGHHVVQFDKARSTLLVAADNDSVHFGLVGMTLILVAANKTPIKPGHSGGVSTFFGKEGQGSSELIFNFNWFNNEDQDDDASVHLGVGEGFNSFASQRADFNDGEFRVYTAALRVNDGWDLGIRVNGQALGSQDQPPVIWSHENAFDDKSMPGQPVKLGEVYGQPSTADAAELVVIKGTPDMAEVAAWETYLMNKYAVTRPVGAQL